MQRGRGDVQYEDILVGDGEIAQRGRLVEIQYTLSLNHGDIVQRDQLYEFRIGEQQVVAGLEYGVEGMRVGGQRHIRVGPHLAYRDQAIAGIPPNAVLNFVVSLLRVVDLR